MTITFSFTSRNKIISIEGNQLNVGQNGVTSSFYVKILHSLVTVKMGPYQIG